MSRQNKTLIILVVIAVVFSAAAFLIPFPKTSAFFVAYIAELVAIALQIPIFKTAFEGKETLNSKVLGFPVFRVGYYYLGIQTVLSLAIFALGFVKLPVWIAALLCIIVLGGAVACSTAADIARETVEQVEQQTNTADTKLMTSLRSKTSRLSAKTSDPDLKKQLERFAENIRFSDPVSSEALYSEEQALSGSIAELEAALANKQDNIAELIEKAQSALDDRNAACKANK